MRLQEKRVVVTGGASGIGRATASRFAAEGAVVAIADLNAAAAARAAEEIAGGGGRAFAFEVDVTDEDRVSEAIGRIERELGGIEVLINNASNVPHDDLLGMSTAEWDLDVRTALRGPYLCTKHALPGMLARGSGAFVNITSVNALGFYGNEAYSAGKAGLVSLTRSVAVRYGPKGIRANAIAAGTVRTPVWSHREELNPNVFDDVAAWYPLQRVGNPEDIASAALFLASDEASWVTGAVIPVDGGLTAGSYRMTAELVPESEF